MIAMNLRQIDYALAVAEERNFTRAAERCHTVQSALSHQITRLEQEFGARLFERSSRQVSLTAAGRTFVAYARQVRDATQRLRDEMAAATGEIRGTLVLGSISSLTVVDVPQLLADYHRLHPQVDVRLHVGMSDHLLDEMRGCQTDAAFIGLWHGVPVSGVESQLLCEERLVALLHPAHPLAASSELGLAELARETLADFPAGTAPRLQTDMAFLHAGLTRRVAFEANHKDALIALVRQGIAMTLVPERTAALSPDLIAIAVREAPSHSVYFAWARNPTPAAAAFVQMALARTP